MMLHILYLAHVVRPQTNSQRDALFRERYTESETISDLAREYIVCIVRLLH